MDVKAVGREAGQDRILVIEKRLARNKRVVPAVRYGNGELDEGLVFLHRDAAEADVVVGDVVDTVREPGRIGVEDTPRHRAEAAEAADVLVGLPRTNLLPQLPQRDGVILRGKELHLAIGSTGGAARHTQCVFGVLDQDAVEADCTARQDVQFPLCADGVVGGVSRRNDRLQGSEERQQAAHGDQASNAVHDKVLH